MIFMCQIKIDLKREKIRNNQVLLKEKVLNLYAKDLEHLKL